MTFSKIFNVEKLTEFHFQFLTIFALTPIDQRENCSGKNPSILSQERNHSI